MTEEYRRGHAAGYANGIRDTQPNWIRADEQNPEKDGMYWAIIEILQDCHELKQGDLFIDTLEPWEHGEWIDCSETRKILYWAEQPIITPPRELMGKVFRKTGYQIAGRAVVQYLEAG